MITGVQDFYYNVQDMKKAIAFYTEAFGMTVAHESEYWTTLSFHGHSIGLHWTEGGSVPGTPRDDHGQHAGGTLTLKSNDVGHDKLRIQKCGGKILGEMKQDWGHMLTFEDLDGNVLKLMNPVVHDHD
jgi:predicted enzyme related to lactoylglutathione lyase